MGFKLVDVTLKLLCDFARILHFLGKNKTNSKDFAKKVIIEQYNIFS